MGKLIQPGSGFDDMGGGIVAGCFKWVIIIVIAIFVLIVTLSLFKVI